MIMDKRTCMIVKGYPGPGIIYPGALGVGVRGKTCASQTGHPIPAQHQSNS